jgi:hypothetical protein
MQNPWQRPFLTVTEVRALTLYKWRYDLGSKGFTREQADRLMFWRYLAQRRPETVA